MGNSLDASYLGLLVDVPREGHGVVGDLLDVPDRVEALFIVGCKTSPTKHDVHDGVISRKHF